MDHHLLVRLAVRQEILETNRIPLGVVKLHLEDLSRRKLTDHQHLASHLRATDRMAEVDKVDLQILEASRALRDNQMVAGRRLRIHMDLHHRSANLVNLDNVVNLEAFQTATDHPLRMDSPVGTKEARHSNHRQVMEHRTAKDLVRRPRPVSMVLHHRMPETHSMPLEDSVLLLVDLLLLEVLAVFQIVMVRLNHRTRLDFQAEEDKGVQVDLALNRSRVIRDRAVLQQMVDIQAVDQMVDQMVSNLAGAMVVRDLTATMLMHRMAQMVVRDGNLLTTTTTTKQIT